jgi:uncharacterized iron-regulated membrane protein
MTTRKSNSNLLWKIHNWTGLYVGIVIAFLSLTGSVAVFLPEIEALLNKKFQAQMNKNLVKAPEMPINEIFEKIWKEYKGFTLLSIDPPSSENGLLALDFYRNQGLESERFLVFVDPQSGQIIGTKDHLNSISNYFRQVHVRLMDGFYGRQLVGLAGIGLVVISITGLLIYGQFMKKQLFGSIREGRGLRILMADWHKCVGIIALLFNLIIAATGAWLGLQPRIMKWIGMEVPNEFVREIKPINPAQDQTLAFDYFSFLEQSKKDIDGFFPTTVIPSLDGSRTVEIKGDIKGLPYEPNISKIVYDKVTMEPLFNYDIRNQSKGDKFYFIQEGLHFGRFGGILVKIIYTIFGLTSGFLSITGFVIYMTRKKKKNPDPKLVAMKVIGYSLLGCLVFISLGLATVLIGYTPVTKVITPTVYVFLGGFILWKIFLKFKKSRSTNQIDENGQRV